jgi:hypothetical protein
MQFGAFFFLSFTYFEVILPVFTGVMSTFIFIIAGFIALALTLVFVSVIYRKSHSTRRQVSLAKLSGLIICLYLGINTCYYFNFIPPVPLALKSGLIAYNVQKTDGAYLVMYDPDKAYKFWRNYNYEVTYSPGDTIFAYTSIFSPTDLNIDVADRWMWYDPKSEKWKTSDIIGYNVTGGRGGGYRGFTYKTNLHPGRWKIEVVTKNGRIIGTMGFNLNQGPRFNHNRLKRKKFD